MNWSTNYYRSGLEPECQIVYDEILTCCLKMGRRIHIRQSIANCNKICQAFSAVTLDHPELYWLNSHILRGVFEPYGSDPYEIEPAYYFNKSEINPLASSIESWKSTMVSRANSSSPDSKPDELLQALLEGMRCGGGYSSTCHTILGATDYGGKLIVCEGLAKSYKYLCDALDIPCICVRGILELREGRRCPHMWNIVEVNRSLRHVDATKHLVKAAYNEHSNCSCTSSRFGRCDSEMVGYSWDTSMTPPCT